MRWAGGAEQVGSHYLDDGWTQELMTLSAFIARHLPPSGATPMSHSLASAGNEGDSEALKHNGAKGCGGRGAEEEGGREEEARRGTGKDSAPGDATSVGYLAQHPLFEQVRWGQCACRRGMSEASQTCGSGRVGPLL